MSRSLGSKGRRSRLPSAFKLPDHQDRGVKVESGGGPPRLHRGVSVTKPFIITGMLRWSPQHDFFVEAEGGEHWLLDLPWLMTEEADRLLHHRVAVEGGRIGPSTLSVSSIAEAAEHRGKSA